MRSIPELGSFLRYLNFLFCLSRRAHDFFDGHSHLLATHHDAKDLPQAMRTRIALQPCRADKAFDDGDRRSAFPRGLDLQ